MAFRVSKDSLVLKTTLDELKILLEEMSQC